MVATDGRRASVLDQHFSYVPRLGVTDGYPGYDRFLDMNRRRCWAHITREADAQSEKSDSPEILAAGRCLKERLHYAKGLGPPEGARQHDRLVAETREIAAIYERNGCKGFCHKAWERRRIPLHVRTASGHGSHQQPGRAHAETRRDRAQDTVRAANCRWAEDGRHHGVVHRDMAPPGIQRDGHDQGRAGQKTRVYGHLSLAILRESACSCDFHACPARDAAPTLGRG